MQNFSQKYFSSVVEYSHGYNGMEKDDEVKGDGNSYTTEFRQYDSRVGRWLSIDPVTKASISLYCSMSDNPIILIDPRGNDDYFDSQGNFLYSTNTEVNFIRIVYMSQEEIQSTMNNNSNYQAVLHNSSVRIQDIPVPVSVESNAAGEIQAIPEANAVFTKIALHYVPEEDKKYVSSIGISTFDYAIVETNEVFIDATFVPNGILKLSDDFNANDLTCVLRHEIDHLKVGIDMPNSASDPYLTIMHLDIYKRDLLDPNFVNATYDYRQSHYGAIENRLNSLGFDIAKLAAKPNADPKEIESLKAHHAYLKKEFDNLINETEKKATSNGN